MNTYFCQWVAKPPGISVRMKTRNENNGILHRIYYLYRDGFRGMTVGRYLWALILIKLFILFFIFKLFFFPNLLNRDYNSDEERAQAVRSALMESDR